MTDILQQLCAKLDAMELEQAIYHATWPNVRDFRESEINKLPDNIKGTIIHVKSAAVSHTIVAAISVIKASLQGDGR